VRIDRKLPASIDEDLDLAVVIDVLRASSTAAALLMRVEELALIAAPDQLRALPARAWLIASELDATASLGMPRMDNSPVAASEVELAGRTPLLVTTNGSRALCAAATRARRVLFASFVNLTATVRAIQAIAPARVTLLPAGDFATSTPHAEDERCADALAALLSGDPIDLPGLIEAARRDARIERRLAREPGLVTDLALTLTPDARPVAAEFFLEAAGAGWIRRCG
jgi:phosphosulfolactate phosphohydrolase-like enzyme